MQRYGVRDVERLLRLSRNTLRALVAAGFVTPTRGPRNAWRFSFQDLIVLRTAQALADAKVPQRRITRSVRELRRNLPATMPLSGLSIAAVGDRVVVRDGAARWQAESGQYLLAFEGDGMVRGTVPQGFAPGTVPSPSRGGQSPDWFEEGVRMEGADARGAMRAYQRALATDPERLDARVNLGRLLHEAGRMHEAERVYREGLEAGGESPLLLFNLGVLLEDMGHKPEAILAYEAAITFDAALADAHYNAALLYEDAGKPRDALRHMARYRKLAISIKESDPIIQIASTSSASLPPVSTRTRS